MGLCAQFGGYDDNGDRIRLVHIPSGDINMKAIPLWKRYDLSMLMRENWNDLREHIDGKIRISIGTSDNFYLHHAVKLLEKEMKNLDANMEFDYYPGVHFTICTDEYKTEGNKFLTKCYEHWKRKQK